MSLLIDQKGKPLSSIVPRSSVAVVPSDVTIFTDDSSLYISTGGTLVVYSADSFIDGTDILKAGAVTTTYTVPSSFIFPFAIKQVLATGTTASGIIRHY